MQCYETLHTRITPNGVITPIVSSRNKPNIYGICYKYGKKAGVVKKTKCVKEKDFVQN